ncbi:hypothetical protein ACO1O0_001874 [Amphichorda felina]
MEQVALHWNECLQLAEEEKQGAVREIRRLQDDVARKSKELDASQTMVSHHQRQVQEIEERCKKIEEQQSVVSQHNEQLSGEVETLRKELCDSKGKAAQLGEKYKTYKDKINDAIGEQQDLYKRSQTYYQHLFKELEQERTKKNDKVGEIDEALRVSQEKRSEMKKVFEEFRVQIGEESRKKDENIVDLKAKIATQETDLVRERDTVDHLRVQIDETQVGTYQAVQNLETKVNALTEVCEQACGQGQQNHEITNQFSEKLASIMEFIKSSFENVPTAANVEFALSGLEDKITSRVALALSEIHSRQGLFENNVTSLGNGFMSELKSMKEDTQWYMRQRIDETSNKAVNARVEETLGQLHRELMVFRGIYEDQGRHLLACIRNELDTLKAEHDSREAEIRQQLSDRDNFLTDREQQLQVLIEDYADFLRKFQEKFVSSDKAGDEVLKTAVSQFQERLDTALTKEREWSAQQLQKTQAIILSLQGQMEGMTTAMSGIGGPRDSPSVEQLRRELQNEKSNVLRLTEEVHKSAQAVTATEGLRERWMRDIQGIDSLRAKLSAAHHRIPRVEGIAAKLESIARLNGLIHSTTNYLSTEKRWIQEELTARPHAKSVDVAEENRGHHIQPSGTQEHEQQTSMNGSQYTAESNLEVSKHLETWDEPNASQDNFSPRKVTVLNPAMDFRSPSPPPSIEQEQMRRREGTKPRSILRSIPGFEKQTGLSGGEALSLPLNHSQYNRPVMATWNSTSSGNVFREVVEQIRSGLLSANNSEQSWGFPTVAKFERSSQQPTQYAQLNDKRKAPVPVDNIHNIAKRFKSDSQETSPGDLKASVKSTETSAKSTRVPLHRPALRTYSRKVGE